ncbi:MAG: ABC transporter ATP-binding protein [Chloroflexota bacterium]
MIIVEGVSKSFTDGDTVLWALKDVSFQIQPGAFVIILGASGSGKSTLLNLLGGLDKPSSGKLSAYGYNLNELSKDGLAYYRFKTVGFIFQSFHLLSNMTAIENVAFPLHLKGVNKSRRTEFAVSLLEQVQMEHRMNHPTSKLSGGERQRIAIARALINDPSLILADEPTGALDSATGIQIMELLYGLSTSGKIVIIVTHQEQFTEMTDDIIRIHDGRISIQER